MNIIPPKRKTDERCRVEAAAWRTRLSEEGVESTPEFEHWLATDVRHREAWAQVERAWTFIGDHGTTSELLELRRVALSNAREAGSERWVRSEEDARCDYTKAEQHGVSSERRARAGAWRSQLVAAAAIAVIALAWFFISNVFGPDVYHTDLAEQRLITLSDGSRVQLDAATELRVRYSSRRRELTLIRGQASFEVAHDIERPFVVSARSEKVVATGTAFNVDLLGSNLLVTLLEGQVAVLSQLPRDIQAKSALNSRTELDSPDETSRTSVDERLARRWQGKEVILNPGEQLIVSASGKSIIVPISIERATAWQNGQLVFDDESLAIVVQRINRYSRHPLLVMDTAAAQLRLSGVFNTSDIDGFVDTLTRYLPVDAAERDGSIYLRYRAAR